MAFSAPGRLTDLIGGTHEVNSIWTARNTIQSLLDVEAALAIAEGMHDVIPKSAMHPIVAACKVANIDAHALMEGASTGGNLAIPLVKQLTAVVKRVDPEAARFVHWGATSQDIIDTATVLQLRATLDLFDAKMMSLCSALAARAVEHRATPMVGRTWLQQALPITLGLKLAQWLDALLRHREHLVGVRHRILALHRWRDRHACQSPRQGSPGRTCTRGYPVVGPTEHPLAHATRPHCRSRLLLWHVDRHTRQNRTGYLAAYADRDW